MISDETYLGIKKHCKWNDEYYTDDCYNLLGYAQAYEIGNIDLYSLYTPKCLNGSNSRVISRHKRRLKGSVLVNQIPNQFKEEPAYDPCSENYAEVYFNRPDVQKALHANTTGIDYRWTACRYNAISTYPHLRLIFPRTASEPVGGRSVEYEGLTFVTIRGAGHEVPLLHRGPSLVLFHSFLSGESVPRQKRT
ncbi:hypothetical protein Mapa_007968 [Marchantia paleacea]|nr:hypothetical protein Mapa_007968 [Marchantia paleacea]